MKYSHENEYYRLIIINLASWNQHDGTLENAIDYARAQDFYASIHYHY